MSTSEDPLIGQLLAGQFRIERQLGAGGMGAVYLAEQAEMGRRVVVKVMHPELTVGSPQAVERFKREARAVAALNHPHIVQVYVFGQADDGRMYLAMELIDGRDLAHELEGGPIDQARAIRILDQVASALIEAHAQGIVHRDLKPENIMLSQRHGNDDWVKVLDFGIAKVGAADTGPALTQAGAIFGTPRYMAPEQIQGNPVDARTDLYALGIILYEMLTGEHPFRAKSALDYLIKHVNEALILPSQKQPELALSPRLEGVLTRLLAKEPADRFQSAADLQRELRAALAEVGDPMKHTLSLSSAAVAAAVKASEYAATVTSAPEGPPPRKKKSALPWIVAGLVLVGGGVGAVLALGKTEVVAPILVAGASTTEPVEVHTPPEPASSPEAPVATADVTTEDTAPEPTAAEPEIEDELAADEVEDEHEADEVEAEDEHDGPLHRAFQDIEGLPVPEGTVLAANGPTAMKLTNAAPPDAVREFFTQALEGRARPTEDGFTITDRRLPFTGLTMKEEDGQTVVDVARRPVVIAKPKLEPAPRPPEPPPVVGPRPGRDRRPRQPLNPIHPPTEEQTRRPMRERTREQPTQEPIRRERNRLR